MAAPKKRATASAVTRVVPHCPTHGTPLALFATPKGGRPGRALVTRGRCPEGCVLNKTQWLSR